MLKRKFHIKDGERPLRKKMLVHEKVGLGTLAKHNIISRRLHWEESQTFGISNADHEDLKFHVGYSIWGIPNSKQSSCKRTRQSFLHTRTIYLSLHPFFAKSNLPFTSLDKCGLLKVITCLFVFHDGNHSSRQSSSLIYCWVIIFGPSLI